jgi:hypothetical protein
LPLPHTTSKPDPARWPFRITFYSYANATLSFFYGTFTSRIT